MRPEGSDSIIYLTYVLYKFKLVLDSDSDKKNFFLLISRSIHEFTNIPRMRKADPLMSSFDPSLFFLLAVYPPNF